MFEFLLLAFVSIFIILDSFANVPIFVALLNKCNGGECTDIVRKAVLIAFTVFVLASFFGNLVFDYLHIKMYSFEIAGGILLFVIALEMLFGLKTQTEFSENEREKALQMEDIAAFPLAMPLIVGPGAITTGVVLANQAGSPQLALEFLGATVLAFVLAYLILSRGAALQERVPHLALKAFARVMGLLLAALAVQLVTNGLAAFLATM
ncbi:MAG TPA: NAAT family transporter [Candidatus Diapherotrites archaeon]|uniref:UPF0056 membrane protein n=1 Tax=Candidatus Iainarchaeum sp. TaxID=3101447 RepID=A0A7J4JNR4_9ARCH|nr:NAAT family transporter [Candidatus Diapherotrites archaeon]HIH16856.1 NAAT family transporter [Candidatus Diapherotrites archaeon]